MPRKRRGQSNKAKKSSALPTRTKRGSKSKRGSSDSDNKAASPKKRKKCLLTTAELPKIRTDMFAKIMTSFKNELNQRDPPLSDAEYEKLVYDKNFEIGLVSEEDLENWELTEIEKKELLITDDVVTFRGGVSTLFIPKQHLTALLCSQFFICRLCSVNFHNYMDALKHENGVHGFRESLISKYKLPGSDVYANFAENHAIF